MPIKTVNRYGLAAALLAAGGWLAAPVTGKLRDFLLSTFPGTFLKVLAGGLALLAVGVGAAAARVAWRRRSRSRALWWTSAMGLLGIQLVFFAEADGSVNVVEKVHIVQYGLLALLAARAFAAARGTDDGETVLSVPAVLIPAALVAAVAGLVDESVQGFFQLRTGDIRDVGLNTLSALMGACVAAASSGWSRQEWDVRPAVRRRIGLGMALWIFGLGLFLDQAHLGYRHRDPEIGEFQSWFTLQELKELADARRRTWTASPPTGLRAWDRQDYFLTEAAWHANHRNERLQAEDWLMAWRADQILRRYYDPFLDIESFRGSGKHRWDPDLHARVEAAARVAEGTGEASTHPSVYRSPVLGKRIYVWPRAAYRVLWGMLVLLFLVWACAPGWEKNRPDPNSPLHH